MATEAINRLVTALNRLPGVGAKSARRIALDMLTWDTDAVRELADVMVDVKSRVKRCSVCFNLTEGDPCEVCTSPRRDATQVMVVDYVGDLLAVERTGLYRGHYHVLDGRISPLDGISAEDLNIQELLNRVRQGVIQEVILANGPTVEGDATAQYLAQCLVPLKVKTTQVARGLPVGSDLALADQVTLSRALEGRREY
jgi:recombination protein RecR